MNLSKEAILKIVKSKHWQTQGFNGIPLYLIEVAVGSGWGMKDLLGISYSHFLCFFSNGRASFSYDEADFEALSEQYYNTITSREQLENIIAEYKSSYRLIVQQTAYKVEELPTMNDQELIVLMRTLCKRLSDCVGAAHAIEGITFGSEKKLRAVLERRGQISEQEFGFICSPLQPSFLLEVQQVLWKIKYLTGPVQEQAIDDFLVQYGWSENTYLGSRVLTRQDVLSRASHMKEEPLFHDIREQKETALRRFELSSAERFVVTTIEYCFHWQDERKKYILQSIGAVEPVLQVLAERFGIDLMDLKFITSPEVTEDNLRRDQFKRKLHERRQKSVYYGIAEKNYIFTGGDFDLFFREFHVAFDDEVKELKGVVASPGIVRGVVKICDSIEDIDKIQVGEVLVASMTRPEYLPAMQKAVAFVTDEGGITSHAAIVAREMKKPCVIGTRVATKVLKDGDMVEVDAVQGIVTVLHKP